MMTLGFVVSLAFDLLTRVALLANIIENWLWAEAI